MYPIIYGVVAGAAFLLNGCSKPAQLKKTDLYGKPKETEALPTATVSYSYALENLDFNAQEGKYVKEGTNIEIKRKIDCTTPPQFAGACKGFKASAFSLRLGTENYGRLDGMVFRNTKNDKNMKIARPLYISDIKVYSVTVVDNKKEEKLLAGVGDAYKGAALTDISKSNIKIDLPAGQYRVEVTLKIDTIEFLADPSVLEPASKITIKIDPIA